MSYESTAVMSDDLLMATAYADVEDVSRLLDEVR